MNCEDCIRAPRIFEPSPRAYNNEYTNLARYQNGEIGEITADQFEEFGEYPNYYYSASHALNI